MSFYPNAAARAPQRPGAHAHNHGSALTAADFAKPTATRDGLRFGMGDKGQLAAQLRRAADFIESGDWLVTEVHTDQITKHDDWSMSRFTVTYTERGAENG